MLDYLDCKLYKGATLPHGENVVSEISVIIPVYNVSSHLKNCLDSLLAQTFTDFEAICVNDGSTDNSSEILKEYQKKDSRIKIIDQRNFGVSHARNIGMEKSSSPYLTFIDSDDEIHPQLLSVLIKILKKEQADIAGCYVKNSDKKEIFRPINEDGISVKKFTDPLKAFLCKRNLRTEVFARLYKRELLAEVRFTEGIRFEDVPFSCTVMNNSSLLAYTTEKLYIHCNHQDSFINSEFTLDKAHDYTSVMHLVNDYFSQNAPSRLDSIRKYIVNRRFKMVLNQTIRRQKNPDKQLEIFTYFQKQVKEMYAKGIISYAGLNLKHRIQLHMLLHNSSPDKCLRFSRLFSAHS